MKWVIGVLVWTGCWAAQPGDLLAGAHVDAYEFLKVHPDPEDALKMLQKQCEKIKLNILQRAKTTKVKTNRTLNSLNQSKTERQKAVKRHSQDFEKELQDLQKECDKESSLIMEKL